MPEKNLLTPDYSYLLDADGEYIVISEATTGPLVTRNTPLTTPGSALTSLARHLLQSSTGNTVVARSLDLDIFTRGGTQPLVSPKSPLFTRRDSLVVDPYRVLLPGIYATTRYGYSHYGTLAPSSITNDYGPAAYGTSTYTASTGGVYGVSYGSGQYA